MIYTHFTNFYRAMHGREPFPWQQRLAEQVTSGKWPDALNLPTSAGKTAVVDIWLWAHVVGLPGTPRRLFYVIDRRVLVDAVAHYAADLAARCGIEVGVVRARGGVAADDAWMMNPARPTLVSTTVDQFGSRLLCRAYGVGRYSAPIHAGLAGNDALVVIDEAHLVAPFLQTLAAVARLRRVAASPLALPWQVLTMTATPLAGVATLGLEDGDRAHPLLAARLAASKLARLVKAAADGVQTLVNEALALRRNGAAVVGVVVNTVAVARRVYESLAAHGDALLVIGRARPLDREGLARELMLRCGTGTRSGGRSPLFVVATQTIEVGVDLDFDALVTELAPVSALRQRFGRLDRLGELGQTNAAIVKSGGSGLPYGKASLETAWAWLHERAQAGGRAAKAVVNFGVDALGAAPTEDAPRAPLLLPDDIELLFDPALPFDLTPYLHGERKDLDVYIAWRGALDELAEEDWCEPIENDPPQSLELMPIPLNAARAWLAGQTTAVSDLDANVVEDSEDVSIARRVVRWDGESAAVVSAAELRLGDVLVAPASYGGCDRFGWHPESRAPVRDYLVEGRVARRAWSGDSTRTRRAVGLAQHLHGVGAKAAEFALQCGLPRALIDALAEAGRLHDLGKNDPRYQLLLGAEPGVLLAKSGPHEAPVSRQLAGLPRGWRHEIDSVARRPQMAPLVRYLVGSHHGRGRPWLPAAPDVALWRRAGGAQWPALVRGLTEEYGHWGLAYLEALLRLADWARSAEEQAELEAIEEIADAA